MMDFETLEIERDNGVLTLWLNQPDKRNALSAQMIEELSAFASLMYDEPSRVVVLRARGQVFCAGGDLAWMQAQLDADRETRMHEAGKLAQMLSALNQMPKPLVSAVHGSAFGGAVGLMAVSDVIICDPACKFGLTETRLGLIPATIGPYVLARMGEGMARRVFMSARIFDAVEAQKMGLVSEIADDFSTAIRKQTTPYLQCAPQAVARAKALARRLGANISQQDIDESICALADCWESEEARLGIESFFAKTAAPWVNS